MLGAGLKFLLQVSSFSRLVPYRSTRLNVAETGFFAALLRVELHFFAPYKENVADD
jgi:hypothetical protein